MKKVSIIIPTYNEEKHIGNCLRSIFAQDYPKRFLQVIVIDNDSTDKTLEIARELGAEVRSLSGQKEEVKRSHAIRTYAKGEIIGMIDADNYLPPYKDWLRRMIAPFDDSEIAATDPVWYACRKQDNMITQYGALIGGDDPVATYLGLNDRYCYFNNTLVGFLDKIEDKGDYYKIWLNKKRVPALGCNGFFFRRKVFDDAPIDVFLHPIFVYGMVQKGHRVIAKVKQEIIHIQPGNIRTYFKRKLKRIRRRKSGELTWSYDYGLRKRDLILTSLYIMSILPVVADSIVGWIRKPSKAWLFHPVSTFILFLNYVYYILFTKVKL